MPARLSPGRGRIKTKTCPTTMPRSHFPPPPRLAPHLPKLPRPFPSKKPNEKPKVSLGKSEKTTEIRQKSACPKVSIGHRKKFQSNILKIKPSLPGNLPMKKKRFLKNSAIRKNRPPPPPVLWACFSEIRWVPRFPTNFQPDCGSP